MTHKRQPGICHEPRRKRTWGCSAWLLLAALLLLAGAGRASAQTTARRRPCEGQAAFAVIDRATGQIVARGWTTPDGTLGPGLVLGANRDYIFVFVNPSEGLIGETTFRTGPNGTTGTVPRTQLGTSIDRDSDGDGVQDEIESVFGTNPRNPSTFGGGISDRAFVTTPPPPGTPVGSGFPAITGNPSFGPPGIVQSIGLPGVAVDVSAFNGIVAVASLTDGVSVFNVFGGGAPRLIAAVDTPGQARAVACVQNDIAAADGPAGLAIIDIRDPAAAAIRAQVILGSDARAVAASAGVAYTGLENGQLAVVNLGTALEIQRLNLSDPVHDVFIAGDFVYVLAGNTLHAFASSNGFLTEAGRFTLPSSSAEGLSGRKRLFVGGGIAYAASSRGFNTLNVENPEAISLIGAIAPNGPGSFKQVVANGSGLGLAPVGVTPRDDGTHDISLYDLSSPADTGSLISILPTPGIAYANTIYNGLSYVADGPNGLQVIRFLETDRQGLPPSVVLESNAAGGTAEEGQLFRVTADAADDLQVRNVEFYIDGERQVTDGNFPFELAFPTPLRAPGRTAFTVRARAFDTGGNSAWSEPLAISLIPDATPPRLAGAQPGPGAILGRPDSVTVVFSEPLAAASVNPDAFRVLHAGPDGLIGTEDDLPPPPGSLIHQDGLNAMAWMFSSPLPAGRWHVSIGAPLADRAGNPFPMRAAWDFYVFDQADLDADGLSDELEADFGMDPGTPDTRGDGLRDGQRDFDNDGLPTGWEIYWGLDPSNSSSTDPDIRDRDLDPDGDALAHAQEWLAGTDPSRPDTDRDGWNDETEVTAGSNPLDPDSIPRLFFAARPRITAFAPSYEEFEGLAPGMTFARPVLSISLPRISGEEAAGTVIAYPRTSLGLPAVAAGEGIPRSTVVSQPPVYIGVTASGAAVGERITTIAKPPIKIELEQ